MNLRTKKKRTQLSKQGTLTIATFSTNIYSETFIQQHINQLPFQVVTLYGPELTQTQNGKDLLKEKWLYRVSVNLLHHAGWLRAAANDRQISNFLRKSASSVVLAEYGTAGCKLMGACSRANIPLVVHFHGFDAYINDVIKRHHDAYQLLFRQCAAIIGVSRDMCAQLSRLGAPKEKLHYVPYFVDTAIFHRSDVASNLPLFLSVGRFVEKKAPFLTLLAFSRVLQQAPSATLQMVGDGPLLGATKQLAISLGVADSVRFLGVLPHGEIAARMQVARCFVQHSVTAENGDSEGTPVAVLEAQASGLPVVSTHHAGIKDVVVHQETGYLVEEFDVNEMAKYMTLLASNAKLAGELGESAAHRIRAQFSKANTIDELARIIASVARRAI